MSSPVRESNGRAGTGPGDAILGDNGGNTFPEPKARPSSDHTASGDDSLVVDDTSLESDVVGGDTPPVGPSSCPLFSGLILALFLGCWTFSL